MGTNLADKSGYIEAHGSEGSQIEDGINYVKKNAEMSLGRLDELLRSVSSAIESVQPAASNSIDSSGPSSNTISNATEPASYHTGSAGSGLVTIPCIQLSTILEPLILDSVPAILSRIRFEWPHRAQHTIRKPRLKSNSITFLYQTTQCMLISVLKLRKVATCFISKLRVNTTSKNIVIGWRA